MGVLLHQEIIFVAFESAATPGRCQGKHSARDTTIKSHGETLMLTLQSASRHGSAAGACADRILRAARLPRVIWAAT